MSWSPHPDSTKVPLKQGRVPTQELSITYSSQNVKNGERWAFGIAFTFALFCLALFIYYIRYLRSQGDQISTDLQAQYYGALGVIVIIIICVMLWRVLLYFFMPGNVVQPVPHEEDAVIKINASGASVLGLISFFFYKLFCRKRVVGQD